MPFMKKAAPGPGRRLPASLFYLLLLSAIYSLLTSCKKADEIPNYYPGGYVFVDMHKAGAFFDDHYFDKVYGIGSADSIKPVSNSRDYTTYKLYLSLHATAVDYVFEKAGHSDTLHLEYSNNISFSEDEGYQAKLYPQKAASHSLHISSFHDGNISIEL
jgi:hypothetical protein